MQLDSNTLIFSIGILSLLMAFIAWTFPSAIAGRDDGLKVWAVGICLVGFSLTLTFLRGRLHPFFGVFLANAFLMGGGTLGLLAPARFLKVKVTWLPVAVALCLCGGGLAAYLLAGESIAFAMVGVCFGMAIVLLYSVQVVLAHSRRPVPFPAKVFAASMGFMGVAYAVRAALVVITPQVSVAPVSLAGSHQSMLIVGALFVVSSTISFYSMVHDEQKREIAERAKRDPLTGLFNRRAFFELAAQAEKDAAPCAIVMVDIDHFKSVNDTYGHLGGDAVLSYAGRLVQGFFRIGDLPCRFGGEEFCVLLRHCNGHEALERAVHLVQAFNRQPVNLPDGRLLDISISAGVSEHTAGTPLLRTIQRADEALYEAKHQGRNQARFVPPEPAAGATPAGLSAH